MENLFIQFFFSFQMMYKSQLRKIDLVNGFVVQGQNMYLYELIYWNYFYSLIVYC